jgi:hypothetical protein
MSRSSIGAFSMRTDHNPIAVCTGSSHDPDFQAKAHNLCSFYLNAHRFFEQAVWDLHG